MSYLRSEERQRQILAVAKKVFAERGFHAANVSHICAAAGIGRGTLYQYFANKHAVLTAILRETLDRVRALMETMSREAEYPAAESIPRSVALKVSTKQLRRILGVVFDDSDTLRILLREAVGLDAQVEGILGEIDETLIGILEQDLKRAQAAGFVRACDARMVATLIVGGVEKLGLAALRGAAPVDLDAMASEATAMHAIGIMSDRLKPD
jgi:TetR/AcrR family fatty acid metabolism transcriptional regulator